MNNIFQKYPTSVLDFEWDWTKWLESDETISSADIILPSGLTSSGHTNTTKTVTAWIAGGISGSRYSVACQVTTDKNRIDSRYINIDIL